MDVTSGLRNFALGRVAAEQAQAKPTASANADSSKHGALVIVDNFLSSTSHGFTVESAGQSLGAPGPSYRMNHHQMVDGRVSMPHAKALKALQTDFASPALLPATASAQLDSFVTLAAAGNIGLATSHLATLESQGFQNSVVNLSQGVDAINLMDMIKMATSPASKLADAQKQQYQENLRSALSNSSDTAPLSEKELDQRLLQRVNSQLHSDPEIQHAVAQWRSGVQSFESGRNSVVVAAGNSGKAFQALNHQGFTLDGSEDSNLLAVPEVTTVGATTTSAQGELSLSHSSFGSEVDILASGDHQGRFGTSYASPKVANALRTAHLLNPEFSSEQAEAWVKEKLSISAEVQDHPVAILSSERTAYLINALEQRKGSEL